MYKIDVYRSDNAFHESITFTNYRSALRYIDMMESFNYICELIKV